MLLFLLSCCLLSIVSGSEILPVESSWSGRIVGGSTAMKGQFPYQVSLRTALFRGHFCGGFIITDRWIGSAAHCTVGRVAWGFIAVAGAVSRTLEGTKIAISKFVNHPEFDRSNLNHDITLLKTNNIIEFTPLVQSIRLGSAHAAVGTAAVVSGWGYTSNPGQAASNLQFIKVKTMEIEECRKKMSEINAAKIFETSMCAQAYGTGGGCMGDSGGPLVANNVIIGIISWGVPCSMGFPDVYTRIDSYHAWIDTVLDF